MIFQSSLQRSLHNLPNDCQALAKERLSAVTRGEGGWKSTRQEPTLEKLDLRHPLVQNRNGGGFEAHPAPSGVRGLFPEEPRRSSTTRLSAARSPRWPQPFANAPVRGARPRERGGVAARDGEKVAGPQMGTGLEPHRRRGLRGKSPPGTHRQRGRAWPRSPPRQTGSDKGPAPAVGARGREGCPAQAQTVAAPASGRPAASPHSCPAPRLAGRPDSPSRAVPMSWSRRARICAWADMMAGEGGRDGREDSSRRTSGGGGGSSCGGDEERCSRRPRAHLAPSRRGGRREEVRQCRR